MKIAGFKSEAQAKSFEMLPAGAYVCAIKNVKIDGPEPDQRIVLRLDIIEGEWAAYYTRRYEHDSKNADKYAAKYKGDYALQIPDERNEKRQHPEWDLRTLNGAVWCIEQSNPGFKWDGDTDHIGQLKGKTVGINVRAGTFNGVPYTKIGRLEVADDVRKGIVKPMKPLADRMSEPPATSAQIDPASGFTTIETDELPF